MIDIRIQVFVWTGVGGVGEPRTGVRRIIVLFIESPPVVVEYRRGSNDKISGRTDVAMVPSV